VRSSPANYNYNNDHVVDDSRLVRDWGPIDGWILGPICGKILEPICIRDNINWNLRPINDKILGSIHATNTA